MYDPGCMSGIERGCHLSNEWKRFFTSHWTSRDTCCECFAIQQFHCQKQNRPWTSTVKAQVMNPADIRVRYTLGELNLTLKTLDRMSRLQPRTNGLQCDSIMEQSILCFIDVSHTALADSPHNFKAICHYVTFNETTE
jgi:hypothetical protein